MKVIQFLGHPIIQVVSFCIILVGSPYFGGPYIFFIYHALQEGYLYAIAGALAIIVSLSSLVAKPKDYVQLAGAVLMVVSLLIFFFSPRDMITASTFHDVVPLLTLLLFIAVVITVTYKIAVRLKM